MAIDDPRDWRKALGGTINLVVLGASGMAAAATLSWQALAVGGLTYSALVLYDVLSGTPKSFLPIGPTLPDANTLQDIVNKGVVESLQSARKEIESVLKETPAHVRADVVASLNTVPELERHTIALIARSEDLHQYLKTQNADTIRREYNQIGKAAEDARDRTAREEYLRAQTSKGEQLRALDDILGARERIHANLARIVASLDALPPKLVRMRALDAQSLDAMGGSVSRELDEMNKEIKLFEQTLESLAQAKDL
jgi:hypothetical protein